LWGVERIECRVNAVSGEVKTNDPWLPIGKHGQGVQSLAIIFLFRAFVENALGEPLPEEAEPILALEEPEAHLHPQACRSLWLSINALPGQKLARGHKGTITVD
jgi:putative ATP-dependent endonuclease of the OLD family